MLRGQVQNARHPPNTIQVLTQVPTVALCVGIREVTFYGFP